MGVWSALRCRSTWSALGPHGIGNRWSSAGTIGQRRGFSSAGQRPFTVTTWDGEAARRWVPSPSTPSTSTSRLDWALAPVRVPVVLRRSGTSCPHQQEKQSATLLVKVSRGHGRTHVRSLARRKPGGSNPLTSTPTLDDQWKCRSSRVPSSTWRCTADESSLLHTARARAHCSPRRLRVEGRANGDASSVMASCLAEAAPGCCYGGKPRVVALNGLAMRLAGQECQARASLHTARVLEQQVPGKHDRLRPELRLGNPVAPGRICEP
jgi:hypothetical protein